MAAGNYAYGIADQARTLQIINVTDKMDPQLVRSVACPNDVLDAAVNNNTVYVALGDLGLGIVDITDPPNASWIAVVLTSGTASGVVVEGNYAYVADHGAGITVMDISDADNPVKGNTVTANGKTGMLKVVAGNGNLYTVMGTDGVATFSLGSPANPTWEDTDIAPAGTNDGLNLDFIAGNHLCLADGWQSLSIFDLADPDNPTWVTTHNPGQSALDVSLEGDYAYVAQGENGMRIVDLSTLSTPVNHGQLGYANTETCGVEKQGNFVYECQGNDGMFLVDITNPDFILPGGMVTSVDYADIAMHQNIACLADRNRGLVTQDISDPASPVELDATNIGGAGDLFLDSGFNRVYVLSDSPSATLFIYDIETPASIQKLGSMVVNNARKIVADDGIAYIAAGSRGLVTIDVTPPDIPAFLNENNSGVGTAVSVAKSGNYAYVADSDNGLAVYSVFDPNSIAFIRNIDIGASGLDVLVHGDYVYVSTDDGTVVVLDKSTSPDNPGNPKTVSLGPPGEMPICMTMVDAENTFLYVGTTQSQNAGIRVLDISPLPEQAPTIVRMIQVWSDVHGIAVSDPYAYLAATRGLLIFE